MFAWLCGRIFDVFHGPEVSSVEKEYKFVILLIVLFFILIICTKFERFIWFLSICETSAVSSRNQWVGGAYWSALQLMHWFSVCWHCVEIAFGGRCLRIEVRYWSVITLFRRSCLPSSLLPLWAYSAIDGIGRWELELAYFNQYDKKWTFFRNCFISVLSIHGEEGCTSGIMYSVRSELSVWFGEFHQISVAGSATLCIVQAKLNQF